MYKSLAHFRYIGILFKIKLPKQTWKILSCWISILTLQKFAKMIKQGKCTLYIHASMMNVEKSFWELGIFLIIWGCIKELNHLYVNIVQKPLLNEEISRSIYLNTIIQAFNQEEDLHANIVIASLLKDIIIR